jgi:hypothetical protein
MMNKYGDDVSSQVRIRIYGRVSDQIWYRGWSRARSVAWRQVRNLVSGQAQGRVARRIWSHLL